MADTDTSLPALQGADIASANARQAALDAERTSSAARESAELAPLEAKAGSAISDLGVTQPPKPSPVPARPSKPLVDPQDYQKLSLGLIGMALIGGVVSKGNWLQASSSLNGALKGFMEGNQARAEEDWRKYQADFDAAKAHDEAAQNEFQAILTNKRLTINDMLTQVKIAAAKYGREDVRMEAEQKSIDGIWRRIETMSSTMANISDRDQRQRNQIEASMALAKLRQTGGAEPMSPEAQAWVTRAYELGDSNPMKMIMSRFGAKNAIPIINKMAQDGVDPGDTIAAKKSLDAYGATLRQSEQRKAGVERLTKSIVPLEDRVSALVAKVNGGGAMPINRLLNVASQELGSKDYSELKTLMGSVGRQYVEAITMPGSNAQLHATTQDWADGTFSPDVNSMNWEGVKSAMNQEISATHAALEAGLTELTDAIRTGTRPGQPGGAQGAPQPHQPFADPAKEQRYQEWKKQHAGGAAP